MKDKPILFSAPMVKALLADAKTQTRRICKPQPSAGFLARGLVEAVPQWPVQDGIRWFMKDGCSELVKSPVCPGMKLIVKESAWLWCERRPNGNTETGRDKWHYVPLQAAQVHYVSDHPEKPKTNVVSPRTANKWMWKFKGGRYLPSWANRITLEVTGVRVERLGEIRCDDIRKEGITVGGTKWDHPDIKSEEGYQRALRGAWADLWTSIHGKYDPNIWLWVIEFRRVK